MEFRSDSNLMVRKNDDLINNPSPRCPCMLVLDTSGSMDGEPIKQLNIGVQQFIQVLQNDNIACYSVELGVISAGGQVCEELPFTTVDTITEVAPLVSNGTTPLGKAVELALQRVENRKADYRRNGVAYYQPWIVIISDGAPDPGWEAAAQECMKLSREKKLVVLPIGVDGADMSILDQFSSKGSKALNGLKFKELFEWLSASMSRVSASNSTTSGVVLPKTDSWDSI